MFDEFHCALETFSAFKVFPLSCLGCAFDCSLLPRLVITSSVKNMAKPNGSCLLLKQWFPNTALAINVKS